VQCGAQALNAGTLGFKLKFSKMIHTHYTKVYECTS
jgi:hypothetical protein